MSKLHRNAEGQVIQFVQLPRIFQVLSGDLPSGAVTLPNGEKAYWRLQRNISEMKSQQSTPREISEKLAEVFKALTSSSAFLNHYGLSEAPKIGSPSSVAETFRNLMTVNTQRVEYSTITHGVKKQLVETLTVPFGNQVYLRGTRGNTKDSRPGRPAPNPAKVKGVKGKLWLSVADREDEFFEFILFSPVVHLPDFIREDQLKKEIINKLKNNMGLITNDPTIVFDDGQFNTVDLGAKGLQELAALHPAAKNGNQKKATKNQVAKLEQAPIIVNETQALTKEAFAELDKAGQDAYLEKICDIAKANKPEDRSTLIAYMVSGILEDAWKFYVKKQHSMHAMSQPFFLAQAANILDTQFEELMGDEPKRLPYVKPVPGQKYQIVDGDTLTQIALDAYGYVDLYPFIVEWNDQIKNADQIQAGWEIVIPELVETPTDDLKGYSWTWKIPLDTKPSFQRIEIKKSAIPSEDEAVVEAVTLDQCKSMAEAWGISDQQQRRFYLDSAAKLEKCNDPAHDEFFRSFLLSGILETEWKESGKPSHTHYLAELIQMSDERRDQLLKAKPIEGFDPASIVKNLEAEREVAQRVYKAPESGEVPDSSAIGVDLDASSASRNLPEEIVLSTSLESFLATSDPANFVEGTRAILTAPDGKVTTLELTGGDWHGTASA